jgi:hypothetical protein
MRLLSFILVLLLFGACTTPDEKRRDFFDQDLPGSVTGRPPPAKEPTGPRPVPVSAHRPPTPSPEAGARPPASIVADRMKDDIDCEREIERLVGIGDIAYAWSLTEACAERDKLRSLAVLFLARFKKRFDSLPDDAKAELATRVLAVRGGALDEDLLECRRANVNLHPLAEAFRSPKEAMHAHVVFRGRFSNVRSDKRGVRLDIEELGRDPSGGDGLQPTGRTLAARATEAPVDLGEGEELVFLAELESIDRAATADAGEATVRLIRIFRPGRPMLELRRRR